MIDAPAVAQLAELAGGAYGPRTALRFKRAGAWHTLSYSQLTESVDAFATGLLDLGVLPGDHVGILSDTRHEWTLCDLAVARAGAVSIPVYPTSTLDECTWVLTHARVGTVVCDTAARADIAAQVPGVDTVLVFDPEPSARHRAWEALRTAPTRSDRERLRAIAEEVRPDDLATVIYTSGTTGHPKGCMLTHANWQAACNASTALLEGLGDGEEVYLHLPLAHVMSRSIQYITLTRGAALAYFGGDIRDVITELGEIRPTVLPSVPRLFEKAYTAVRDLPPEAVAKAVGGRIRLAVTGAAPMAREVFDFFASCGIPVLDAYGMTESSALMTANRPDDHRPGTVGRPLPGVEIRISEEGEILSRGSGVFAGYLHDPEATSETLADGWLHTGDLGELDADGYLTITGRKKELIITATGKNIAPAALENGLRESPWISQAVMVGDRRPHAAVLVTLDPDAISAWAANRGLPADLPQLARHADVLALIQAELDRVNARFAPAIRARAFTVLDHDFTIEDGTLTPTLKVRRTAVAQRYGDAIDALYG
ncbi:AMP-dependent synthetase/ligase [Wenjunlia tyrosinilytica]|nr:AMP-dependent synthetase/ligase [Wenjunlia tyrosinilytica]